MHEPAAVGDSQDAKTDAKIADWCWLVQKKITD